MAELNIVLTIKFKRSVTSAESIKIVKIRAEIKRKISEIFSIAVKNLLKFVNADINHVNKLILSEFFRLHISIN